jgi:hypothetical protein
VAEDHDEWMWLLEQPFPHIVISIVTAKDPAGTLKITMRESGCWSSHFLTS